MTADDIDRSVEFMKDYLAERERTPAEDEAEGRVS